jgi:hypothetical protein
VKGFSIKAAIGQVRDNNPDRGSRQPDGEPLLQGFSPSRLLSVTALQTNKKTTGKNEAFKILVIFLLFITIPLAWRWTSLNEWVNFATIIEWQQSVKDYPAAFYLVVGAYLLASLFLFPVTVLNVATVLTFGPIQGNLYALFGWLASATVGYGIGWGAGQEMVARLARSWSHRLLELSDRHGFLTGSRCACFPLRLLPWSISSSARQRFGFGISCWPA